MGLQENIELGGQNMSSYIEVRNVSKSFGGKAILQDVSLSIELMKAVMTLEGRDGQ